MQQAASLGAINMFAKPSKHGGSSLITPGDEIRQRVQPGIHDHKAMLLPGQREALNPLRRHTRLLNQRGDQSAGRRGNSCYTLFVTALRQPGDPGIISTLGRAESHAPLRIEKHGGDRSGSQIEADEHGGHNTDHRLRASSTNVTDLKKVVTSGFWFCVSPYRWGELRD